MEMRKIFYIPCWQLKTSLLRRPFRRSLREMEKIQWMSGDKLHEIQWSRVQAIITHAYKNVPYYRRVFREVGFQPGDMKKWSDFRKLPILEKRHIRDNLQNICADMTHKASVILAHTGGSTGEPLSFYRETSNPLLQAALLRHRFWYGWRIGDSHFHIWAKYSSGGVKGWWKDIHAVFSGYRLFNAFEVTEEKLKKVSNFLERWQPKLISGYVTTVCLLASYLDQCNSFIIRPKAVETTAEKLLPQQRKLLEKVFQCPVFDMYGCNEIFTCAGQCGENDNLHIFNDIRLIECLKGGKPAEFGEVGELVITDLLNYSFPFIRYRVGDMARLLSEQCSCGRGFPLMTPVEGRRYDTIVGLNGQLVNSQYFATLFYGIKEVEMFRVWQKQLSQIELQVVPRGKIPDFLRLQTIRKIKDKLGSEVRVEWKEVRQIPLTPEGKRIFAHSDVPIDFIKNV